jgi:hypothetical protein
VHLESEETAHLLRKKHQEVVVDFQDQIDQLSKARARFVYQKSHFPMIIHAILGCALEFPLNISFAIVSSNNFSLHTRFSNGAIHRFLYS